MRVPARPAESPTQPGLSAGSTGGLRWHWRALCAGRRWANARRAIESWLDTCPATDAAELILIGASAGWMMSSTWLSRFRAIEAIDLDPIARPLFGLRHGMALRARHIDWYFHRDDGFEDLDRLLDRWPQAVVLFDNVLGQLRYRYADGDELELRLVHLADRLEGRLWGSVHDWLSGPAHVPAGAVGVVRALRFEMGQGLMSDRPATEAHRARRPRSSEPGAPETQDDFAQWLLARVGGHGVWQDHLTGGVFPVGSRGMLIPWQFSSTHVHWLQAAWVDARFRAAA